MTEYFNLLNFESWSERNVFFFVENWKIPISNNSESNLCNSILRKDSSHFAKHVPHKPPECILKYKILQNPSSDYWKALFEQKNMKCQDKSYYRTELWHKPRRWSLGLATRRITKTLHTERCIIAQVNFL